MFSGNLKEKASQVKTAGVKSYGSARDKLAPSGGPSTAKAKPPPPPPPPRKVSGKRRGDLRTVSSHPSSSDVPTDVDRIDWANLSHQDKQVFFSWLDEFFACYLDHPQPSVRVSPPVNGSNTSTPSPRPSPSLPPRRDSSQASQNTGSDHLDVITAASAVGRRNLPPVLSQRGPPKINLSTRPPAPSESPTPPHLNSSPSHSGDSAELQMSFPPPADNGSAAADLALYMHPSTSWDTDWYTSNSPIPPHLNGSPEIRFAGAVGSDGRTKTARGAMLFSDFSMCWFSVMYGSGPPVRWARFRPRPEPISAAVLQRAAQTHGAVVAAFAVRAEASGRPVARGECWDIAHEALLHAATLRAARRPGPEHLARSRAPTPLWPARRRPLAWRRRPPSRGRCRRMALEDTVPRCAVADGDSVRPADVGVLTVVEQTAGRAPRRASYDLAKLQEGEVWVYRPVGMVEYLGSTLSIDIPSGLRT
ncbi:hypothetical protein EDB86DRAFT_3080759 [Lactarius hatsudake]|nr:hypothetical protein EDB86DRAFT_3080759 [Lactarius hatsudake]